MDENKSKITLVGNTNDCNFNTIQEALDNVEENSVIQVKPGIYNEHLSFTKKVHLIGCNESIKDKSSVELPIVVFDENRSCEINVPVEIEGIVFTHKKDLQFESLSTYIKTTLEFEDVDYTEFRSLFVINSESNFSNIAILSAKYYGITFNELKSNFKNSFIHHAGIGLCVRKNATSIINNCTITNSNIMGIRICDSSTPQINSCKIDRCNKMGIYTEDTANPTFTLCELFGTLIAIQISETSVGLYENCNIHNNSCGIRLCNSVTSKINKCTIHNNEFDGIMICDDSKPTISDCEIHGNDAGLGMNDNSTSVITKCEIHNNKKSGIHSHDTASATVRLCEIHNQPTGIQIQGVSHGLYERCLIYDCSEFGVLHHGENVVTIKDCAIYKNAIGLMSCKGKVIGSEIYQNSTGINLSSDSSSELDYCDIHDNNVGVTGTTNERPDLSKCKLWNNSHNTLFLEDIFL